MSPEQSAGKELDHRVDVYALGIIFFELLTGRVPFVGESFMGILTQHMFEPVPSLASIHPTIDVPDAVQAFLSIALAKDPAHRFAGCDAMARGLSGALRGEAPELAAGSGTVVGFADTANYRPKPVRVVETAITEAGAAVVAPARGGRSRVLPALVGAGLLAAAGAGWWWLATPGPSASDAANSDDGGLTVVARDAAPDGQVLGAGGGPDGAGASVDAGLRDDTTVDAGRADAGAEPSPAEAVVTVQVTTTPPGAHVFVEGRGEVCASTPCAFETAATPDEITVRARSGRNEASRRIRPLEVRELALRIEPRRGAPRSTGATSTGGTGHGDLKIPDWASPR